MNNTNKILNKKKQVNSTNKEYNILSMMVVERMRWKEVNQRENDRH